MTNRMLDFIGEEVITQYASGNLSIGEIIAVGSEYVVILHGSIPGGSLAICRSSDIDMTQDTWFTEKFMSYCANQDSFDFEYKRMFPK